MSWLAKNAKEMFEQIDCFEKLNEVMNLPDPDFRPMAWELNIEARGGQKLWMKLCALYFALQSCKKDLRRTLEALRKHRSRIEKLLS